MHEIITSIKIIGNLLGTINRMLAKVIAWSSIVMSFLLGYIIIERYFFHLGSIALQELVGYFHAILISVGFAYTLQRDQHVRVDIVYPHVSTTVRCYIDILTYAGLLIPLSLCLIYFSFDYVAEAWHVREGSREAGGLPYIYLLKSLLILFPSLLIIEAISKLCKLSETPS